MMPMNVLISGAGIAGPTLAYWLAHYGNVPTIIEKAPELRTGGYIIDFWGSGFDVAEKMNLLPVLLDKGYMVREVRVVNRDGTRISGFPAKIFADLTNGRFTSLPRGDLAASIFHTIDGSVETIFGDSIRGIEQSATGVHVSFQRHPARTFDLVVGADGLLVEVHPCPDQALSDGIQSLDFEQFRHMMWDLEPYLALRNAKPSARVPEAEVV